MRMLPIATLQHADNVTPAQSCEHAVSMLFTLPGRCKVPTLGVANEARED